MFKFFAFALLFAAASAQWREGVLDSRCPANNANFPTFLPGPTCNTFFMCNDGFRFPFTCPGGNHWNVRLETCDLAQDAGCTFRNNRPFFGDAE